MNSMPETNQIDDQINDTIVEAAMIALAAFHPETPEQAADMLLFWIRRHEMTDADVAEVTARMFPVARTLEIQPNGSLVPDGTVRRLARQLADGGFAINPDGDPSYLVERINTLLAEGVEPTPPRSEWAEQPACEPWCTGEHIDDGQFRDCTSEETFVPQANDKVVCVDVATTFNRATGLSTPVLVRVEDYSFNPQYARHLATLLVRAADLADAS